MRFLCALFLVLPRLTSTLCASDGTCNDAQAMLQMYADESADQMIAEANGSSNNSLLVGNGTVVPPSLNFRFVFTESHGSDHVCLTEAQFLTFDKEVMQARYQFQSSCYGCPIACEGCESRWGNPQVQFDGIRGTAVDQDGVWSCTSEGSFKNAIGNEIVAFSLPSRPSKVVFDPPELSGEWTPRSWLMQEQQADGSWQTVGSVSGSPRNELPEFYVQAIGSAEFPADWPVDFERCSGAPMLSATETVDIGTLPKTTSLFGWSFLDVTDRHLSNNGKGKNGWGMSIDGDFGSISVPTGNYVIKQLVVIFPTMFKVSTDLHTAEGEVDLIMQKVGSGGSDDLSVVVVPLRLPWTKGDNNTFFPNLGLETLPRRGTPEAINGTFNLGFLETQLHANLHFLNCSETVPWFVLDSAGFVSAQVVESFRQGPPAETTVVPEDNSTVPAAPSGEAAGSEYSENPILGVR